MKKVRFTIFWIVLSLPLWAASAGNEWITTALSPSSLGTAYSGTADPRAGNTMLNPASPAMDSRFQFSSLYGGNASDQLSLIQLSLPLTVGKFSSAYSAIHDTATNDLSRFSLGFSRELTEALALGFNGYALNRISSLDTDTAWGMDLGVLFRLPQTQATTGPIFLANHQFGLSVHGIGKPAIFSDDPYLPPLGVRVGWRFHWLEWSGIRGFAEIDGTFDALPFHAFGSFSSRFEINRTLALYGGLIYGKGIENLSFWTAGASVMFKLGDTDVEIFYHLNPEHLHAVPSFLNSVGLEIAWGNVDRTPPKVSLKIDTWESSTNTYAFSPNYDGARDRVNFRLNVKDASPLISWEFIVMNESGKIVRTISQKAHFSTKKAKEIWNSLWQAPPAVEIPEKLSWDGSDDSGNKVPDGRYLVFAKATDLMRNEGFSRTNFLRLDTVAPEATLGLSDDLFSPDGDGNKDSITIFQNISKISKNDNWKAQIRNTTGKIIKSWEWKKDVPTELIWDGKDQRGDLVPDGVYDYILLGSDDAGNRTLMNIPGIRVNTSKYSALVDVKPAAFSPILNQTLSAKVGIPHTNGLQSWTLLLKNDQNQTLRKWKGNTPSQEIIWKGKDAKSHSLPDGTYSFEIQAKFDNGAQPREISRPILLDQTPPSFEFGWAPEFFTPDKDGKNDELEFHFIASDLSGIDHWKIEILNSRGENFKTFEGKGSPATNLYWDGRSDQGELIESARSYPVRLSVFDVLGNSLTNVSMGEITAGILLEQGLNGWKIALPPLIFEPGDNALVSSDFPILDRLSEILTRFPKTKIELRGYSLTTESSPHQLSLARSEAAKAYLTGKGIAFRRLQTLDGGTLENTVISNGRVEFVLKN